VPLKIRKSTTSVVPLEYRKSIGLQPLRNFRREYL
jgi:hypothetical protein